MFSSGYLLWIGISAFLIVIGLWGCRRLKPDEDRVLKVCLALGAVSEAVKLFSVIRILPMVGVEGVYTPYLEMADLPLELCSLQIPFMAAMLMAHTERWRSRLRALIYVTGVIGGLLGIVLAEVTVDYSTVQEYFCTPRIYQFFLYHSMVVTLGLYMGGRKGSDVSLSSYGQTMGMLVMLDIPTFYINSVFSQPVYEAGKPVAVAYRVNFFSSYVNPLGLPLSEKWQWLAYLGIRLTLAAALIWLLLAAASWMRKMDRTA